MKLEIVTNHSSTLPRLNISLISVEYLNQFSLQFILLFKKMHCLCQNMNCRTIEYRYRVEFMRLENKIQVNFIPNVLKVDIVDTIIFF